MGIEDVKFEIFFGGSYYTRAFLDGLGLTGLEEGYYYKGRLVAKTWEEYCSFADIESKRNNNGT